MLGSANRDPEVFTDPDRFDVTRNPTGHVALGYGPHVCLGAALAEMETEVALSLLLDRFPDLRAADTEPKRVMNPMLRGFAELRLAW
ncbi:cytochrome P450 [Streptomyces zinciresistens]|nr:cytochrome P450 [Streptomyces zinciresistens]